MRAAPDVTLEKPLPSNPEAERMVLGCVLLDNTVFEQTAPLAEDDFFSIAHRKIYGSMRALASRGEVINPLTLQEELWRAGELERAGGPGYIADLHEGCPRFSQIESYVRLVKNSSRERRLILFANSVITRAFDGEQAIDEQLRQAEQELFALGDGGGPGHWRDIASLAYDALGDAERRAESGRDVLDFASGFRDLDYMTDGFERGTLVVIGAAPKMGKTGFALSLTSEMSEAEANRDKEGRPPLIAWYSMEMSAKQQAQRLLASVARVSLKQVRTGYLNRDQWRALSAANLRMANWRVRFDDRAGISIRAMREGVRRLKIDEGQPPDVLIVDYLQLADGERQRGETREQEVARISVGLTQIAKDYNLTVIALSQLNRQLFNRADKRPGLGDFRDSGQIGQDATLVIGLHREEVYKPDTEKQNIAEVIVLANRHGPIGAVEVVFLKQIMRFEDKYRGGL